MSVFIIVFLSLFYKNNDKKLNAKVIFAAAILIFLISLLMIFANFKSFNTIVLTSSVRRSLESNSDFSGADFSYLDLSNRAFTSVVFEDANFEHANLDSTFFLDSSFRKAHFDGASVSSSGFYGADFSEAVLFEANLSQSSFLYANFSGADLSGADLLGADLLEANLSGVNLLEVNLLGANLLGADLSGAKNYTDRQIKSACNWDKVIYKVKYNSEKQLFITSEPENTKFIEDLKNDSSSDPIEFPDCSRWVFYGER